MSDTSAPRGIGRGGAVGDGGVAGHGGGRLTWRIFVAVGSVVAIILVGTIALLSFVAQRTADVAIDRALDRTSHLISVLLDGRQHSLTRAVGMMAQNPIFRASVLAGHPEDVFDFAVEASERTGALWVQVVGADGTRLARSDDPTAPRISIASSALIAEALSGTESAGFGATDDSLLFQAVAVPIITAQVDGALMAVQAIDSQLVAEVVGTTSSDVVFYTIDDAGIPHVTASSLGRAEPIPELVRRAVRADGDSSGVPIRLELGGTHYVGRQVPVHAAGGEVLGGFLALRAREVEMAPFLALRRWILLGGAAALALAFALSFLVARSIARPVLALARATRRVADGDYTTTLDVQGRDEIGTLADSVRVMLNDLREKEALVGLLRERHRSEERTTAALPAPVMAGGRTEGFAPGHTVANRFFITAVVGEGGAGIVYRAHDRELGEVVALKTMRPETLDGDSTALERLKSEIRLARRIAHRNVVRTYDLGEASGVHFISMEYVTGTSLRALIDREGRLPVPAAVSVAKQLCRALEVAHAEGIIHRDIKPHNLMLQPDGTLKVMDFGIARLVRRTSALTQVGVVVGTPAYMAPEQLLDEEVDERADLYAVATVLYESLTGTLPFEADVPLAMIGKKLSGELIAPRTLYADIPAALSDLVVRALARDPVHRPSSAESLHEMLVEAES